MVDQSKKKQLMELFASKAWRMSNLYYCKDEKGKEFKFICNEAQSSLIVETHPLNIILKARQMGITTFYCINFLDDCLFNSNITAVLIGDDLEDAKKLLRDKAKYAYDRLPAEIKEHRKLITDSTEIMRFSNGSSYSVTTSARSGTVQRLHITEFGKICRKSPDKAEEIMSGSLNTVHLGQQIVIESTAQGASGHFFNMCQTAESKQRMGEELTPMDWKFHFFGWWKDGKYQMEADYRFSQEQEDYFRELAAENIKLTQEQKIWYCKKRETQGELMKQEFPSNSIEAFDKIIVGAYYAKEIAKAEEDKRIGNVPYDQNLLVSTWWDLGMRDSTAIWFTQRYGKEIRIIDYFEDSGEGLAHYIRILKEKNYLYDTHNAPHDIVVRELTNGKSRLDTARELGINFQIVPKIPEQDGVNAVRALFNRCWFDKVRCEKGLLALKNYQKEWDERMGRFKDRALHNWASHGADAFRYFAVGFHETEYQKQTYDSYIYQPIY